jgi:hypothetical protein
MRDAYLRARIAVRQPVHGPELADVLASLTRHAVFRTEYLLGCSRSLAMNCPCHRPIAWQVHPDRALADATDNGAVRVMCGTKCT